MVTTIITVMAAYSNERVAAIILSVLYRMLTLFFMWQFIPYRLFQHYNSICPNIPQCFYTHIQKTKGIN